MSIKLTELYPSSVVSSGIMWIHLTMAPAHTRSHSDRRSIVDRISQEYHSPSLKNKHFKRFFLIDPNTQPLNLHRILGLHSVRNCKLCTWHDFSSSTQALGSYVSKNHVTVRALEPWTLDICLYILLVTIECRLFLFTRAFNVFFTFTKCYTCITVHHKNNLYL